MPRRALFLSLCLASACAPDSLDVVEDHDAGSFRDGSEWEAVVDTAKIRAAHRAGFDVFASPFSVDRDEATSLYVRSPAPYEVRIYRLGWYDGNGAELVYASEELPAQSQDGCGSESDDTQIKAQETRHGLVECAWTHPIGFSVGADDPRDPADDRAPGLHLARISANIGGTLHETMALFVVRDDGRGHGPGETPPRLVVLSATSEQVYNGWSDTPDLDHDVTGFRPLSMYGQRSATKTFPQASKVSFNRPIDGVPNIMKTDYGLLRYLEREGFDYTLATDHDLAIDPHIVERHKSIVLSGHGEYWSSETRQLLDNFVAAGNNIVAMVANAGYWQIRYENSVVGSGPVVVGYKEHAVAGATTWPDCTASIIVPEECGTCSDPDQSHRVTTLFRDPAVNYSEQGLFGVQYQKVPAANGWELPVTLFTDVLAAQTSTGSGIIANGRQTIASPTGLGNIGWEGDAIYPEARLWAPSSCTKVIGEAAWAPPYPNPTCDAAAVDGRIDEADHVCANMAHEYAGEHGNYVAHQVLHRPHIGGGARPPSGHVFGGLSMLWSLGLDHWAALHGLGGTDVREDDTIKTLTRNMLVAAETGSFGNDCTTPPDHTVFFGKARQRTTPRCYEEGGCPLDTAPSPCLYCLPGATPGSCLNCPPVPAMIVKENQYPGRWSIVDIVGRPSDKRIAPNPRDTADLSGWAVATDAYEILVGDVNGDGLDDLVSTEKAGSQWYVALGDGEQFHPQPAAWITNFTVPSAVYDLFLADVNQDGAADLIAKEKVAPGRWWVALSDRVRRFRPQTEWLAGWAVHSDAYDLFVADVDADGRADVIAKEKNLPGNWYVAKSMGNRFAPQATVWLSGWASVSSPYDLFVADVDADRRADLIAKEKGGSGNWYVAKSTGGRFVPQATVWLSGWASASAAYELYVADVTNDARADLVARERSYPGGWYVARSTGGRFIAQATPALAP